MRAARRLRIVIFVLLYLAACGVGGVFLADATLHPVRRPLTQQDAERMRQSAQELGSDFADVSIAAGDGVHLHAWLLHPHPGNGNAVILLHGLSDNRAGTGGYAQMFLANGLTVLMPDARAHGSSEGVLATYGLLERGDIQQWFQYLSARDRPSCIFGLGESMGAAQLLQSLSMGIQYCAVVAESSFADFREIAYDRMGQPFHLGPWVGRTLLRPMLEIAFLRARWKYGFNMENILPEESAGTTTVPILLIHGAIDSNIPVRHSQLIHNRNPQTQLWVVADADHCGAFIASPKEFEARVIEWLSIHAKR